MIKRDRTTPIPDWSKTQELRRELELNIIERARKVCNDNHMESFYADNIQVYNMYASTAESAFASGEYLTLHLTCEYMNLRVIEAMKTEFGAKDVFFAPMVNVTSVPDNKVYTSGWKLQLQF